MKKILVAISLLLVAVMALSVTSFAAEGQKTYYVGKATTTAPVQDGKIDAGEYTLTYTLDDPAIFVDTANGLLSGPASDKYSDSAVMAYAYDNDYIYIAVSSDLYYKSATDFGGVSNYQFRIGFGTDATKYVQLGLAASVSANNAAVMGSSTQANYNGTSTNLTKEETKSVFAAAQYTVAGNAADGYTQTIELKIDKAEMVKAYNTNVGANEVFLPETMFFAFREQTYNYDKSETMNYSVWNAAKVTNEQKFEDGLTVDYLPYAIVMGEEKGEGDLVEITKKPEAGVTTPVDTTPVDTTPVDTTPVDTTPVDTTPADTTPVDTTPADTTPAGGDDGCGSSVTVMGVALVATLGTCAVFATKKKED